MRFNEALRKVTLDFKQKFLGECLNGEHCPVGVGPGLIPHPLDPAGGLHTGNWLHETQHRAGGIDPLTHPNIGGVTSWQHHAHFQWITPFHFSTTGPVNTVANRAYAVPTWVTAQCRVGKLGINADNRVSGNFDLGLYDLNFNLVCSTGALGVGTLGPFQQYNWYVPATTPIIEPGIYWVAMSCNSDYVAAISGFQFFRTSGVFNNFIDSVALGHQFVVRQDGAYPLPNPLVPVNDNDTWYLGFHLRVTSL